MIEKVSGIEERPLSMTFFFFLQRKQMKCLKSLFKLQRRKSKKFLVGEIQFSVIFFIINLIYKLITSLIYFVLETGFYDSQLFSPHNSQIL